MRVFNKYAPVQIAKHVVLLFKGSFEIKGQGQFMFDGGKVVIGVDEKQSESRLKICREINRAIYYMTEHLRSKALGLSAKEELFS
jgi:hypothetical protein